MDGVLCGYNEKLVESGLVQPNQLTQERWKNCGLPPEQVETISRLVSSQGFFESLKPIDGAIQSIEELLALGCDVNVCSRPPKYSHAWSEKYEWIQRHCPVLSERIILTTRKAVVKGDAFIDDSLQELQKWPRGRKILLQTNPVLRYDTIPTDVLHFTKWSDLLRHLRTHNFKGEQ
jgi:5'(3')-deoxyribonucleotidase